MMFDIEQFTKIASREIRLAMSQGSSWKDPSVEKAMAAYFLRRNALMIAMDHLLNSCDWGTNKPSEHAQEARSLFHTILEKFDIGIDVTKL